MQILSTHGWFIEQVMGQLFDYTALRNQLAIPRCLVTRIGAGCAEQIYCLVRG